MTLRIEIKEQPSRSNGWGQYRVATAADEPVMRSRTGNSWLSSSHEADIAEGETLTLSVRCKSGKSEVETLTRRVVVKAGASGEVYLRPGSQGIRLTIVGVEVVA